MIASIFNWKIAIAYVAVGVVLAVIGGTIISKSNLENYVESFVYSNKAFENDGEELTTGDRIGFAKDQVLDIIRRVWIYILLGVGIGAVIHNWIPSHI